MFISGGVWYDTPRKKSTGQKDGKNFISIVLDVKFEFESGALGEQQADDPFMIFGGFIILGFP